MATIIHPIPFATPETYFAKFSGQDGALLLDSSLKQEEWGQYSFIAVSPWSLITSKNQKIWCDGVLQEETNPFDLLKKVAQQYHFQSAAGYPPFQGGMAGLFGYDLGQHLENLPTPDHDELIFPDMIIGLYDLVIGFDLYRQEAWIFSSGFPELEAKPCQVRAQQRLDWLLHNLEVCPLKTDWQAVTVTAPKTQEAYVPQVQKVIDYIYAGDIYQANLSHRFYATLPENVTPWQLYCRLRQVNPAPFSAYLAYQNYVVASASPERFLKLSAGKVETKPIKGTRKRHADPDADCQIAEELMRSEKDRAENIMIVDLMRNDLSRVCQPHTVKVTKLLNLESYATVHHLVTTLEGQLAEGHTAIDLLMATFPGGSITGAPKIRAMEIITQLEQQRRGPYCGSIGYIGFDGAMDLSIVIRSYAIVGQQVTYNVGGGIVSDSEPVEEYEETLTKGAALKRALAS